jgi:hypothetical protein
MYFVGLWHREKGIFNAILVAQNKFKEHKISATTKVSLYALIHANSN